MRLMWKMARIKELIGDKRCAYCGGDNASTGDHVVSRALYPSSLRASSHQRIKAPACANCNNGWSDDEAHFRTMMLLAGDLTSAVRELCEGKVRRCFAQPDGRKRARDLFDQFVPVMTPDGLRQMIIQAGMSASCGWFARSSAGCAIIMGCCRQYMTSRFKLTSTVSKFRLFFLSK
jgi:hypothetical protein